MKNIDLTQGKVLPVLTKLALPIMGSSLLQFSYNLIDMLLVGRLGSDAVASIGSSSLFISLGFSIHSFVAIGTGIKVSHSLGEKNENNVRKYINAGLFINLILAVIYGLILIFGGRGLIGFLNLNNFNVENGGYYYLALHAPILFFNFFNILFVRLLGSFGNNALAFRVNVVGIVMNTILDPIFIYGLGWGIIGAAMGTLVANIVVFVLFLVLSKGMFSFRREYGLDIDKGKEIIRLGIPSTSQRVLFTIINIFLARIIAVFGSDAIAAQKIGLQIESVAFMVIGGFNGAVAAFTGQNYGAKEVKRVLEGYRGALKIGLIYSGFLTLVFLMFNEQIVRLFIQEENTVKIASFYLTIIAFSQVFSCIEMVSNGFFTGLGKPEISSIISIVFTSLRLPMAMIFSRTYGLNGIWLSITLSSVLKGVSAFAMYQLHIKRSLRES